MFDALKRLHSAGVRYASAIDIGCADGSFLLEAQAMGIFDGAATLNIDANSLYEPSLVAIKHAVGGHYWIGAVTDREGDTEITIGAHPYWTSVRPQGDLYWKQINELSADTGVGVATIKKIEDRREEVPPPPTRALQVGSSSSTCCTAIPTMDTR